MFLYICVSGSGACHAQFDLSYFLRNTITLINPIPNNIRLMLSGSGTGELEEVAAFAAAEASRPKVKFNFLNMFLFLIMLKVLQVIL